MKRLIAEYLFSPRSTCLGCGSVLGTDRAYLCADCYASVAPLYASGASIHDICENCGEEYVAGRCKACKKRRVATVLTAAAYDYEGAIRSLVHAFKFGGVWRMSGWMAEEMFKACTDGFLDGVTVVTPVPLHPLRRLMRGYNQSQKLAEAFAKKTGLPCKRLLRRVRNTPQQAKLTTQARRSNLKDAFAPLGDITNETVLLIDDVRTTGSTAAECIRTLKSAGASEVRVLTFARATGAKPQSKKYRPDRGKKLVKPEKDPF